MKRATNLSTLLDCSTPWLAWWQELILNWVASWNTIETLHVTSTKTDQEVTWDVPTDLDLARQELEELLSAELGQREG
jgi:phage anti-repressor protein